MLAMITSDDRDEVRAGRPWVPALVSVVMALVAAGCAAASPAAPTASAPAPSALEPLVDLVAQRLETADTVAAAKFGTDSPIEDPAREKVVLDTASTKATDQGIDADEVRTVFADQIQASKAVQYGLYSRWTAHPNEVPTTKPELGQVRPILDGITDALVRELAATVDLRNGSSCGTQLEGARQRVSDGEHFDALHSDAFDRALVSLCRTRPPR
jgi:chorismate mutase